MRIEYFEDEVGEWRWRLVAANNLIIADGSEGYRSELHRLRAIENVKKAIADCAVVPGKAKRGRKKSVKPRNFFLNEQHELPRKKKTVRRG